MNTLTLSKSNSKYFLNKNNNSYFQLIKKLYFSNDNNKKIQDFKTKNLEKNLITSHNKILCVSAIILLNKNNILLIKRENEPNLGKFSFPGGKIELGENYQEATIREIKEETGLDVILPSFHLFRISEISKYIIITSIVKLNFNKNSEIFFPEEKKFFMHLDKFHNEIFSLGELEDINDEYEKEFFVPGIRKMGIEALNNYDKFI